MKQSKTFSSGFSVEDTIETLRQQLASKDAEIEHLDRTKAEWKNTAKLLDEKLAASQAREMQLRDVLHKLACLGNGERYGTSDGNRIAQEALALPSGTTALSAMIAKACEVMRERCSDSAQTEMDEQYIDSSPWYAARACREAIRDIPCVTLEDLQK